MRRAVLVALFLSMALVPTVQASGGVIDAVSISGNGEVGEGPLEVNISIVGVGGANSASVNWNATLFDVNETIIDYDSGNILVDDGIASYVETILSDAPVGFSNLTISISGDIGTPGQDQWTNYSTVIQRLHPLDVSISAPTYNPVNDSGVSTGNLTINDGDYAEIAIPIINSGDIEWNGSLNLSVDSIHLQQQMVNVSGNSVVTVIFYSNQLSEGMHFVNATLIGPLDSDSSDDIYNGTFTVGPPPLPSIDLNLERLNEPEPGTVLDWILHVNNTGDAKFDGDLKCSIDGEQFYLSSVEINASNYSNYSVSINSKPGQVICTTDLARTSSTIDAVDIIEMTSALFVGAGHSTPYILGGPWHAGDDVMISLLLKNDGDVAGSANLRIEIDDVITEGNSISLDNAKAGEVQLDFPITASGDHIVNWSVVSSDGIVDSNLSGSILIPVLPSQVIVFEIESVNVIEDGVEISWLAQLSEGKERSVILKFGAIKDGIKGEPIIEERLLMPGTTYGTVNIGYQDGQEVFVDLVESGWTIGFGSFTDDEATMPNFEIEPQVTVNPLTQPKVPSAGSRVTVFYTLNNLAGNSAPEGQIVITDSLGEILATDTSPQISSSSIDHSTVVNWPSGDNVKVIVTWHINGKSISDEILVTSEKIEAEEEEITMPWGGILGGLTLGMAIIFAIRIKNSPKKEKKEKPSKSTKKTTSKNEKVEVACPTCDRKLRVPSDYSGAVRCPECETKFEVEGEVEEEDSNPQKEVVEETDENQELHSSSDNDILSCPKCTRKLKVPYERRPAKARCPACTTVFEARKK